MDLPAVTSPAPSPERGWLPAALLLAGLSFALVFTHEDDMDAAIYAIVARNVAAHGFSTLLEFTPAGTPFFEHPPLWLWVLGAVAPVAPGLPLGVASLDGRCTSQFGHGPLYLLSAGLWARARLLAPLALIALIPLARRGDRRRRPRLALLLWIALVVLGYGLAARAYWFYVLPAFVPLALLAGAGVEDLIDRLPALARDRVVRAVPVVAAVASVALFGGGPFGLMRWTASPCPYGDLPRRAAAAARGGLVGAVSSETTTPRSRSSPSMVGARWRGSCRSRLRWRGTTWRS